MVICTCTFDNQWKLDMPNECHPSLKLELWMRESRLQGNLCSTLENGKFSLQNYSIEF